MECTQVRRPGRKPFRRDYQTMHLLRFTLLLCFSIGVLRAADSRRTILFYGDSLTAGYGLEDPQLAFPALIQAKVDAEKLPFRVVNAGLSGETTAGGLRRLGWVLQQKVDVFVLELGGNDGLRGLSPAEAKDNLQKIIDGVRAKNPACRIILAGMLMPPSLGSVYTKSFAAIYPALAQANHLELIPFLLEGVGGNPSFNQADLIHPNARGHELVANTVWRTLYPILVEMSRGR
jgi:acyl-CoA thioesterase I